MKTKRRWMTWIVKDSAGATARLPWARKTRRPRNA